MKASKLLKSFKSANASKKEVREGGKENKQVATRHYNYAHGIDFTYPRVNCVVFTFV